MNVSRTKRRSLLQRVIRAGVWAVAFQSIDQLLILTRTIILAVLLNPADFGLFGIAMVSMIALSALSSPGLDNALIQKTGDIEPYLDIAWTVKVGRGVLVALALLAGAPLIATFFNEPSAESLIRMMGLVFLLQELINPGVLYFHKNLEFHKDFAFRMSGAVSDLVIAICAAILLRSAWAFVLGLVARNLIMIVVSYRLCRYRPRVSLEWRRLFELLDFGVWIWFIGIITLIVHQTATVIVGKLHGVTALGLFQMAQRIPGLALQQGIVGPMSSVAFPAYAKIHNDVERLRAAFLRVGALWAAVCMPIAAGIAVVGNDFTRILLGEKWMPMVPALIVVSIALFVKSLVATAMPLFMGQGQPRIAFYIKATEATAVLIFIYPLVARWGIVGAAATTLLGSIVALAAWYLRLRQRLSLSIIELGRTFGPPFISALTMVGFVISYRYMTFGLLPGSKLVDIVWFVLMIMVGCVTYLLVMHMWRKIIPGYELFGGIVEGLRR